jgi:exosome complex RNA-binding protein Rrp42 (RNase PH superfamily)
MRALKKLTSISIEYHEGTLLPIHVVATRRNGHVIEAGGKLLRTAVIALMALLTNERVPKTIFDQLLTIEDKVDDRIFGVLYE